MNNKIVSAFDIRCDSVREAMQSLKIGAIYRLHEISATQTAPNVYRVTAKLQEAMSWISITEKLPKEKEDVLFCCYIEDEEGFGDVHLGWYEGHKTMGKSIAMETVPGDPGWWYPCTHWMPLPLAPESP